MNVTPGLQPFADAMHKDTILTALGIVRGASAALAQATPVHQAIAFAAAMTAEQLVQVATDTAGEHVPGAPGMLAGLTPSIDALEFAAAKLKEARVRLKARMT